MKPAPVIIMQCMFLSDARENLTTQPSFCTKIYFISMGIAQKGGNNSNEQKKKHTELRI